MKKLPLPHSNHWHAPTQKFSCHAASAHHRDYYLRRLHDNPRNLAVQPPLPAYMNNRTG